MSALRGKMSRLIYLAVVINCSMSSTVTNDVAEIVNNYIEDLTPSQISEAIEFHYKILGLINSNGEWVHSYFNTHPNGISLFPRYLTIALSVYSLCVVHVMQICI